MEKHVIGTLRDDVIPMPVRGFNAWLMLVLCVGFLKRVHSLSLYCEFKLFGF